MESNKKMLYTVSLDENNYILSVSHTKSDDTELNLEEMELKYLNAYQLIEGIAVLDEKRKAELIAEEEEEEKQFKISTLTDQLKSSDEDILEFLEDFFTLKNPITFISDMFNLMKNYVNIVAERQNIRKQIKELQK